MTCYTLSAAAKSDLRSVLGWSLRTFGIPASKRYNHLILTALTEISENPLLLGSQVFEGKRLYQLRHSRKRAALGRLMVKTPRHFILYRLSPTGQIEVIRVLHDSMDIDRVFGSET